MTTGIQIHTGSDQELYLEVSECEPVLPHIPRPYPVVKIGSEVSWFPTDQQLIELQEKIATYIDTRRWVYPAGGVTTGPVTEAETMEVPF